MLFEREKTKTLVTSLMFMGYLTGDQAPINNTENMLFEREKTKTAGTSLIFMGYQTRDQAPINNFGPLVKSYFGTIILVLGTSLRERNKCISNFSLMLCCPLFCITNQGLGLSKLEQGKSYYLYGQLKY